MSKPAVCVATGFVSRGVRRQCSGVDREHRTLRAVNIRPDCRVWSRPELTPQRRHGFSVFRDFAREKLVFECFEEDRRAERRRRDQWIVVAFLVCRTG